MILNRNKDHIPLIVKIQAHYRGHLTRRSISKYNIEKVTRIQAAFRGFNIRKKIRQALNNVNLNDLDLDEFQEVNIDDINTNINFGEDLIIPKGLDLSKFLQPVKFEENKTTRLPPLKPGNTTKKPNSPLLRSISSENSSNTYGSLPPLISTKKKNEERLDEWGFTKVETRDALQKKWTQQQKRKNKKKTLTADEKLQNFRKIANR